MPPINPLFTARLKRSLLAGKQAHAALYQWDKHFALDKKSPFSKVAAPKVLETIRGFAEKNSIGKNTRFGTEVTTVTRKSDRRYSQAPYLYEAFLGSLLSCCYSIVNDGIFLVQCARVLHCCEIWRNRDCLCFLIICGIRDSW